MKINVRIRSQSRLDPALLTSPFIRSESLARERERERERSVTSTYVRFTFVQIGSRLVTRHSKRKIIIAIFAPGGFRQKGMSKYTGWQIGGDLFFCPPPISATDSILSRYASIYYFILFPPAWFQTRNQRVRSNVDASDPTRFIILHSYPPWNTFHIGWLLAIFFLSLFFSRP